MCNLIAGGRADNSREDACSSGTCLEESPKNIREECETRQARTTPQERGSLLERARGKFTFSEAEPGVAVASVFRLSIFTIEEPRKCTHPSEQLQGCGASLGTKLGSLHEFFVLGVAEARALFGESSCLKIKCSIDKNDKDELVSLILAFGT
jgi:hypothetical protein